MITFLHTFEPTAIAFSWRFITVHWYGILVVSGMLSGMLLMKQLARRFSIKAEEVYDVLFYVIVSGLVGARIYAVLLEWQYYAANPDQILAVWNGGLAIHGGIIGGVIALLIIVQKRKYQLLQWTDIMAPAIALGQAIGRWGNYFNQELFGKPTDAPWGIPISPSLRPNGYESAQYFHPTFLYESVLNLLNCLILLVLFKKFSHRSGIVTAVYLINYAIIRILMEQLRIDPTAVVLGVRVPIIASGVLIIIGVSLLVWLTQLTRRQR